MDMLRIRLSPRTVKGKKVRFLRRQGIVPVHMYGRGIASLELQAPVSELRSVLLRAGTSVPVSVEIEGQQGENICFVREVQHHPVTEELLHVDFMRVETSRKTRAEVPVELVGEAPAVREKGGSLLQLLQTLTVEALPLDMPATIQVDVSVLDDFEKVITVADIALPQSVAVLDDPEEVVARVEPPTLEEGEEVEEEAAPAPEAPAAASVEEPSE